MAEAMRGVCFNPRPAWRLGATADRRAAQLSGREIPQSGRQSPQRPKY